MSTKTHIGRQEEATIETGVELRISDPGSSVDTQTWVNKTYNTFVTNTSSSNATLRKFDGVVQLPAYNLDANWGKAYKIISVDSTFTFSNFADGTIVELTVINSDLYNSHTLTFPSGIKYVDTTNDVILGVTETRVYTFTQIGSIIYCSVVKGITPLNQTLGWGLNSSGQLGHNDQKTYSSPVVVVGSPSFISIAGGNTHSLGLKVDGSAWGWGYGSFGQLGHNDQNSYSSPVIVVGGHSFTNILAGYNLSLGLKADGTTWSWGYNADGELGHNDTTNMSSPKLIVGNHSFINISGGVYHFIGLKVGGTAWAWGNNPFGELGIYTDTNNRSSPVAVVGNHSFINTVGGAYHLLGLKINGSVWAWGRNDAGQLGFAIDTTNRSSPVQVAGGHSFISIADGSNHSLGLKIDGSAWGWGYNFDGELGHNDTNYRSSPILVVGSHSFINITCGQNNSLGLKADGNVWAWGSNSSGQLGLYTDTNYRSSPVAVVGRYSFSKIFNTQGLFLGGLVINPNNF